MASKPEYGVSIAKPASAVQIRDLEVEAIDGTSTSANSVAMMVNEVASVKQFFSIGLVGSTAEYSLNPDGSIRVFNSGNYFTFDGPPSSIVGSAVPVDSSNARLNVSFTGFNSAEGAGNYWIVDLDPDYQWAIVSDPTGVSCFLLSRTRSISPELRADLLARAAAKGVDISNVTETLQPPA